MEPAPFLHSNSNNNRYAPIPPPRFSEDRNFYHQHHRHHHLQPSLPLPPPPPPQPAAVPHYHHHPPQFSFRIEEDPRRRVFDVDHPPRVSDHPPRVSDRIIFDHHHQRPQYREEHPRLRQSESDFSNSYVERRRDVWDPPRVPADNRLVRQFPIGWEHEPPPPPPPRHHHLFNHTISPHREALSPSGNFVDRKRFGEDPEGRLFREHSRDDFDRNQKEELFWGQADRPGSSGNGNGNGNGNYLRRQVVFDTNASSSNFTSTSDSRGFRYGFGSDNRRSWNNGEDLVVEDRRWNSARPPPREMGSFVQKQPVSHHSATEMENEETGSDLSNDGLQVFTGKRFHHQSKIGKFKNMVGSEGAQEFLRTPKKKLLPRPSALLRVQLGNPNPRKWKDEEIFPPTYFEEPLNAGTFRYKGPLVFSDHGPEEDREASPVELDVSFKSNALVAKAIMTPSSPVVGSGGTCTPNIKKKRKVMVPVSGLSSLRGTEIHKGPTNGNSSTHVVDAAMNSDKGLTQPEEKVTVSGIGAVDDVASQPYLNRINVSLEKNGAVGSHSCSIVGSDAMLTPKNKKKKRKATVPVSCLSSSRVTEVHEEAVNVDSSMHGVDGASSSFKGLTQFEEKVTVAGIGTVDDVGVSFDNKAVEGSPSSSVVHSDGMCTPKAKKKKNAMVPLSGLPSLRITEIHEGSVNADSSTHGVDAASSSFKVLIKSEDNATVSGIGMTDNVGSQPFHGVTVLLEKKEVVRSPLSPVAGSDDTPKSKKKKRVMDPLSGLSSSRVTENHEGPVNADCLTHGGDATLTSDKDLTQSEEKVIASGAGTMDDVGSQPLHGVTALLENIVVEQSPLSPVIGSDGTYKPKIKKKRKFIPPTSGLSSSQVTEILEGPISIDSCNHGTDATSRSDKQLMHSDNKAMVPRIGTMDDVGLQPVRGFTASLGNRVEEGPPVVMVSVRDAINEEDVRNCAQLNMGFNSFVEESMVQNVHSNSQSGSEVIPVMTVTSCQQYPLQNDNVGLANERGREGKIEVDTTELHGMLDRENCEGITLHSQSQEKLDLSPIEPQPSVLDERLHSTAMEDDSYDLLVKDKLPSLSNQMSSIAETLGVSTSNSNEKGMESLSVVPELHILNSEQLQCHMSSKKGRGVNNRPEEKPIGIDGFFLNANTSSVLDPEVKGITGQTLQNGQLILEKTMSLPSQQTEQPIPVLKPTGVELIGKKSPPSSLIPRVLPVGASASGSLKNTVSSTHIARPRIWRRADNASPLPQQESCLSNGPSQRQWQKKFGKLQSTSYIRKGNSLVRKCAPVAAVPQGSLRLSTSVYLNPAGRDEMKNSAGSESKFNSTEPPNCSRTGGMNVFFERPQTPPLPHSTKFQNCSTKSSQDCTSSTLADPLSEGRLETTPNSTKLTESNDAPKHAGASENEASASKKSETQSISNIGKSKSSKMKRIIYVKRKSNQLVAARTPETRDPSVNVAEKTQALPSSTYSDQYYKRNKNQLIRNVPSLGNHFKQAVAIPDDSSNSEGQKACKASSMKCSRNLSKRRPDKVFRKTRKPSKSSLVWTLHGTQSRNEDTNSLQHWKVFPYLFPWKRTAFWRNFMYNTASVSNKSSFSLVSRKLLLSRKRDTIYTRSTGGFSLRKSKVLSVGGSNLKWSKSIEKHSKKANEEATLAVAAVERKKREQKGAACAVASAKNRNQSSRKSAHYIERRPGERIFRIGSIRYKMDSSKRTLQRIPDETSCAVDLQSGKDIKKSFVPKRLLIGNDEYVRIGNGNQLVRDPKKLIRILASEKIRWSLHTARLRLARKQQYCQFFTRFGKCNKDGGKCPYIHDPAKIAVCTKFLKGLCSNTNCKLTHKVIPERMQDCSYFLQGLCTNEHCPYRHVNVNPNASVCEGFLRGYCADGNECGKKHSYVCPLFEATGVCPQGSICKLHHPKNRTKTRKRKRSKDPNNSRGRYFGSRVIDIGKTGIVASDKHTEQKNEDIFTHEGTYADYISLDVSDEETQETNDPMNTHTNVCDCDPPDLQPENLDELIKPILLMNKTPTRQSTWPLAVQVLSM